jgi:hypothetical protein
MLRRRVPGVLVGCLALLGGSTGLAHAALTPDQALSELNAWRAQASLPAVTSMYGPYNDACHAHNLYMQQNGFGHYETQGAPGYTAAGADAGLASDLFYTSGGSAGPRIFDGAVYHRVSLLEPRLRTSGWDATGTYGCLRHATGQGAVPVLDNTATSASLAPYPWPANGQTNVPRQFGNNESPDPHLDTGTATNATLGYILSVNWNGPWSDPYWASTDVTSASLTPDGGAAVPVGISDRDAPNHLYIAPGFALIPLAPLAANTAYTATAAGAVHDTSSGGDVALPFTVSWRFTTGSTLLPPASTPAPPTPQPAPTTPSPAPADPGTTTPGGTPATPAAPAPGTADRTTAANAAHVPKLLAVRHGARLVIRGRITPPVKGLKLLVRATARKHFARRVVRERADGTFGASVRMPRGLRVVITVAVPAAPGRHDAARRKLTVRG